MKLLVLGGTWFLGKAVAEGAIARGWTVSAFNRGRSGVAVHGVREIHWAWLRAGGVPGEHPRWLEHGIAPERESEIPARLTE
ncbi:hypothetical protein ACFO3J_30285 [Streptomyces polygonati]|uniref:NAD-dependent epimerase/dehydratase domain-containing protein n=1 Tax=Streptomyces polygonati TaxID=1617087 RepID=A0ABV8HXP9_9ACTN